MRRKEKAKGWGGREGGDRRGRLGRRETRGEEGIV